MRIKTHKFNLGKYHIHECGGLEGVCDMPDREGWEGAQHDMHILEGRTLKALHSAIHEAMHAEAYPDVIIHDKDGYPTTQNIARFLWRLGWRRK